MKNKQAKTKAGKSADLRKEYKLSITADKIAKAFEDRYGNLAKTVKMDGFRPGKVPLKVVKQRYQESVQQEVLERLAQEEINTLLQAEKARPAVAPTFKTSAFKEGEPLDITLTVENLPEFALVPVTSLALEKVVAEVSDKDIEEFLQEFAKQQSEFVPKAKAGAVKSGDGVVFDFEGLLNGTPFAGGTAKDSRLVIGSGQFIPGFEEQLIGKKAEEDFSINIRFPDQYHSAELAGKDTVFKIRIHSINKVEPAKLDDAFAEKVGHKDYATLVAEVGKMLADKFLGLVQLNLKKQLFDELDNALDFPLPPTMVEQQFNEIWSNASEQIKNNPEFSKKPVDELRKEYEEMAERRVRLGLYLLEVGRAENVQLSEQDVQQAVYSQLRRFPGQEQAVLQHFQNNPQAIEELKGPLYEDKVVDLLIAKAKIKEKKMPLAKVEAYLQKQQAEEDA